jgi:hypothetical protein
VELQENDGKTERENYLALFSALFSEKITTLDFENRGLIRIDYIDFVAFIENPNRSWKIISEEYEKSPPKIVQSELIFE